MWIHHQSGAVATTGSLLGKPGLHLVHAHTPGWFKAEAEISAGQPAPCLQSQPLYTHCLQTKGCPKSPSPDTFREGESAHLGCPCGCTAHSTRIWSATAWLLKHFCHGFIISPVRWHVPRGWGPCSLPPAQCCGALGLLQFLWASEQIPRGLLAPPRIPGQQASRASSPLPQIHVPGLSLHSKPQPVPEAASLQFYRLNSMTEAPRPGRYNRPLCLHHSGWELRS